ncbi:unnamed protein product [Effrenium voratum]|nr:unnamed protein product [Effrenium voratum]
MYPYAAGATCRASCTRPATPSRSPRRNHFEPPPVNPLKACSCCSASRSSGSRVKVAERRTPSQEAQLPQTSAAAANTVYVPERFSTEGCLEAMLRHWEQVHFNEAMPSLTRGEKEEGSAVSATREWYEETCLAMGQMGAVHHSLTGVWLGAFARRQRYEELQSCWA